MTDSLTGDQTVADWVGFLVLTLASEPYAAPTTDAVREAENTIFADPVLVDMARVAAASAADPFALVLDDLASTLHRDLVTWARSAARNPAPRVAFCVLVVHPGVEEADRLVRSLAATSLLSELPIMFRIGDLTSVPAASAGAAEPAAEQRAAIGQMIVEAINALANEVDRTPEFCLPTAQLAVLTGRGRADTAPRRPSRPRQSPPIVTAASIVDSGDAVTTPSPLTTESDAQQEPVRAREAENAERTDPHSDSIGRQALLAPEPVGPVGRLARYRSLLDSIVPRPARHPAPPSVAEAIDDLSSRADRVSMLYVVSVSAPMRPPRRQRRLRADVATTLIQSLSASRKVPWYMRVFTADRELRSGIPLSTPDLLDHERFPEHWGEHFDLYDSVEAIAKSIDRDTSSFARRGTETARRVAVLLGHVPLTAHDDTVQALADFCTEADIVWVSFDDSPVPDKLVGSGAHFLHYHDDVGDELLRLVDGGFAAEPSSIDVNGR